MPTNQGSSARTRQDARDLLIKALYQWQVGGHDLPELLAQFDAAWSVLPVEREENE